MCRKQAVAQSASSAYSGAIRTGAGAPALALWSRGHGRVSEKGEGRHRRSWRYCRRVGRPSPDRARLGRHRGHRQVGHPDRYRL
ncbi:hypothetical protein, partial [Mesorhizobium sp.]